MVTKVKCVTPNCKLQNREIPTTALYFAKVAPLDGPYECPECHKQMKVVARVLASYKPGASAKPGPRRATTSSSKPIGKKPQKKFSIKVSNPVLGQRKLTKKAVPKKPGPRKRGPNK